MQKNPCCQSERVAHVVVERPSHGARDRRIDSSWVDPFSYFSFQQGFHDWYKKGRCICFPVFGIVHIKCTLLLIGKSSQGGGGRRFSLSLSVWF